MKVENVSTSKSDASCGNCKIEAPSHHPVLTQLQLLKRHRYKQH